MTDRKRILLVCPGRGSYERASLGSLVNRSPAAQRVIDRCDAWRATQGAATVTDLDTAASYRTRDHVAGENASLLTFACGMADAVELDPARYEVVGVVGNSMGFYTALAASGALPLDDAIRLVDTMGTWQRDNVIGGQVLYPVVQPDWTATPGARQEVDAALYKARSQGFEAYLSIDLGGYLVFGGDAAGVKHLLAHLPHVKVGERTFPIQLPLHSAFHTPLMGATSTRAIAELTDLDWRSPEVPLIDGRGFVHRPLWADPALLASYTLGHQVVAPFDFTTAVRRALNHVAPDIVVAIGPGNALGGPLARILAEHGWRGSRGKAAFLKRQAEDPMLLSFGQPDQAERLRA